MPTQTRIVALTFCLFFMTTAHAQSPGPEAAPSPSLKSTGRLLELRTYYAMPGKLEDLHKRFRDHTMRIFAKHGMTVLGFWGPVYKKDGSDSKLTYLLSFKNREERDAKWKEFATDPEWQRVSKESEANGKLLEKIDSVFLYDTDYASAR